MFRRDSLVFSQQLSTACLLQMHVCFHVQYHGPSCGQVGYNLLDAHDEAREPDKTVRSGHRQLATALPIWLRIRDRFFCELETRPREVLAIRHVTPSGRNLLFALSHWQTKAMHIPALGSDVSTMYAWYEQYHVKRRPIQRVDGQLAAYPARDKV